MKKFISGVLLAVLCITATSEVKAADFTDLQLYMGIKAEYRKEDNVGTDIDSSRTASINKGNAELKSTSYTFTTKDSDELVAQALSDNHPEVTDGFIRQLPMQNLIKVLDTVKSASDILKERKRDDLLAQAYKGGYKAPEHKVVTTDPNGSVVKNEVTLTLETPVWAETGDLGILGTDFPIPLGGAINLLSVYGEPYTIDIKSYDATETVFDTTRGNKVYALFNSYVAYIGADVIELMSYNQKVCVRYQGVQGVEGLVTGSVISQGMEIGTTTDFTLGVSLRVADVPRNLLQVYTEKQSKEWFTVWQTKYSDRAKQLVLSEGDTNYHIKANELPRNDANSYTNPEDYALVIIE